MGVLISVIIPVYNVEAYLEECIESLRNQSLKEIEMIFINDGSRDNSLSILEKYKKIDKRIKIINQTNSGPSNARNRGLQIAKGEYISFIDSDDWIDLEMFKEMYDNAKTNNSDVVICDMKMIGEDNELYIKGMQDNRKIFNKKEIREIIYTSLLSNSQFNSMANKIYRKEIIKNNNIKLDSKIFYAEDWLLNMEFFKYCTKVTYINKCFYFYRRGHESSSSGYKDDTFEKVGLWIYRKRKQYAKKLDLDPYLATADLFKVAIHCIISEFRRDGLKFSEKLNHSKAIINCKEVREITTYMIKDTMGIKEKYILCCIKYRLYLGIIIYVELGKLKEKISYTNKCYIRR